MTAPTSRPDDFPLYTGLARDLHEMTLEDIANGKAREAISGITDVVRGTAIPPAGCAASAPIKAYANQARRSLLWTPYEIRLLLDINIGAERVEVDSEVRRAALARFHDEGLIDRLDFRALTPKGQAFINMLLSTPLPVLQIVDPRTGNVVA